MKKLSLLLLFLLAVCFLKAQVTYSGPSTGNWNNPANWSTGQVPGQGDVVRILAGDTVRIRNGSAAIVRSLTIQAGASLIIRNGGGLWTTRTNAGFAIRNLGRLVIGGSLTVGNVAARASGGMINTRSGKTLVRPSGSIRFNNVRARVCLLNRANGSLVNQGAIDIVANSSPGSVRGIVNFGDLTNRVCGTINMGEALYNASGGTFINRGWCANTSTSHANFGSIRNIGVWNDTMMVLGGFPFNNQGSILQRIPGPVQQGVAISNPLNIVNPRAFTVVGFYTNPAGTISAGNYNKTTKEYTPNAAATGLSTVYVRYASANGNCTQVFPVAVSNAGRQGQRALRRSDFNVYPSPARNYLNVNLDFDIQSKTSVELIDIQGRVAASWELKENNTKLHIPAYVTSGIYMLKVNQGALLLDQRKVVIK